MPNNTDILTRARKLLDGITPGKKWEQHKTYDTIILDEYGTYIAKVDNPENRAFIAAAPSLVRELCDALEVAEEGLTAAYMMGGVDKGRLLREAEARAEKAELERDRLAEKLSNENCPHGCPHDLAPDIETCDACWLAWAAQEAEKEKK